MKYLKSQMTSKVGFIIFEKIEFPRIFCHTREIPENLHFSADVFNLIFMYIEVFVYVRNVSTSQYFI
jgi:hypothetical protein